MTYVEVCDGDGDLLATYPSYPRIPLPRVGELLSVLQDGTPVKGRVEDVRHYPAERQVTIELDVDEGGATVDD